MTPSADAVTRIVQRASVGDRKAVSKLMPLVYDELRRLARRYVQRERATTLQATALVHEAYLRLAKDKKQNWQGRTHFLAIAAIAMRRILVERARAPPRNGAAPALASPWTSRWWLTRGSRSICWRSITP